MTIKFNETVTGLDISDFTVNNGSIANIAGSGKDYTLELTAAILLVLGSFIKG